MTFDTTWDAEKSELRRQLEAERTRVLALEQVLRKLLNMGILRTGDFSRAPEWADKISEARAVLEVGTE